MEMEAAAAAAVGVATTTAAEGAIPTTTTREKEAGPRSRADGGANHNDDGGPRKYNYERGDGEIPTDSKTFTVVFHRSWCSSASSRSRRARHAGS